MHQQVCNFAMERCSCNLRCSPFAISVVQAHGVLFDCCNLCCFPPFVRSVVQAHGVLMRVLQGQLKDEKAKARENLAGGERVETRFARYSAKNADLRVSYLNLNPEPETS